MLSTFKAIIHEKRVVLLEDADLPEGAEVLVTILSKEPARKFWIDASQTSLNKIWDNSEDDVYAKLLEV